MILSVLYIWCQFNKDQVVQFWFGTQFKVCIKLWIIIIIRPHHSTTGTYVDTAYCCYYHYYVYKCEDYSDTVMMKHCRALCKISLVVTCLLEVAHHVI